MMMSERKAIGMRRLAVAGALGLLVFMLPGCSEEPGGDGHEGHGGHGEHSEHEGEIHLDEHQLEAAGIETIEAAPGLIEESLHLVARVASNEDTVVHVTPRVEGIVQAVHKGLGEAVKAGDPLAEIWSLELGNTVSAYMKAYAMVQAAQETLAKSKELYARRMKTLEKVLDGSIAVARKIYEREKELQEQNITTVRPFLEADKALKRAVLEKDRDLVVLQAERDTRLLELDVALREARIEENAARERLRVLGFTDEEIDSLHESGMAHGRMVLRAPRDGVILERHITLNEHVSTNEPLFIIHDLSTVWVLASAYEKDIAKLRPGQKAYVHVDALPDKVFVGEVSIIGYEFSAATRAAAVRVALPNDRVEGWPIEFPLRPGMFAEVEIVVDSRQGRVVLPERAIVHEGEHNFVFVKEEGEEGAFARKEVTLKAGARDLVEIVTGVEPGEEVVVKGMFTLKSLSRKEELGAGHSH